MGAFDDAPLVHVETREAWRAWLEANHASATGASGSSAGVAGTGRRVDYGEAVEEALCFGWVDSKGQVIDEQRSRLYFAPRKSSSGWARSNKERVERLIAAGRMAPAGIAAIDRAKANGCWTLLDSVEAGVVPDDLAAAFADALASRRPLRRFPWSARRQLLEWVAQAKRPETRAARILEIATRAARNERAR